MELNFHVSLVTGLAKFTAPTSQNIGRELAILGKEGKRTRNHQQFPGFEFSLLSSLAKSLRIFANLSFELIL
jgi:hypothetical protein